MITITDAPVKTRKKKVTWDEFLLLLRKSYQQDGEGIEAFSSEAQKTIKDNEDFQDIKHLLSQIA